MKIISILLSFIILFTGCKVSQNIIIDDSYDELTGLLTDIDGNEYKTIRIGDQLWMAENLKTSRYSNGDLIPQLIDTGSWEDNDGYSIEGLEKIYGYHLRDFYHIDDTVLLDLYGGLYTWEAAMNGERENPKKPLPIQGVCPVGWHLPSDEEWTIFEKYLIDNYYNFDSTNYENKIAKSLADTITWLKSFQEGTVGTIDYPEVRNKSGFCARASGKFTYNRDFCNAGYNCYWWSSTEYLHKNAWYRGLNHLSDKLSKKFNYKGEGFSVRCIKDNFQ